MKTKSKTSITLRNGYEVVRQEKSCLKRMQQKVSEWEHEFKRPKAQRQAAVQLLDGYEAKATDREETMKSACPTGAYTLKAIADYFGVHCSTVSRVVNR